MIGVVHCKLKPFDIYVGRPTKYGNLWSHKNNTTALYKTRTVLEAVEKYEEWFHQQDDLIDEAQKDLKDKIISCWCKYKGNEPCHGDVLIKYANATTLWRPVGEKELDLIKKSDYTKFPPRLLEQPIFYPVCNETYAKQIATEWNKDGGVVNFYVNNSFISQYDRHIVGSKGHEEYWIPAEKLDELNANIVGKIKITMMVKNQEENIYVETK